MKEEKENLRQNNPYKVPDGYFSDLRNTLQERIADREIVSTEVDGVVASSNGWWANVRSLAGFSAAFGSLVLFAVVGYYFTGYKAQQNEQYMVQEETVDMLIGYNIYDEDIEDLMLYDITMEDDNALFAQEVTEYLDTYGYGSVDVSSVIGSD